MRDGMPRDSISAKQVEERARTSELQRLREKRRAESAQSRPRMPLFGAPMVLTPRPEQPSLSAKVIVYLSVLFISSTPFIPVVEHIALYSCLALRSGLTVDCKQLVLFAPM